METVPTAFTAQHAYQKSTNVSKQETRWEWITVPPSSKPSQTAHSLPSGTLNHSSAGTHIRNL